MKKIVLLLVLFYNIAHAQNIEFESTEFKEYLLNEFSSADSNGDGEFTQEELNTVTYLNIDISLDLYQKAKNDITKIDNISVFSIRGYGKEENIVIENINSKSIDILLESSSDIEIKNCTTESMRYSNQQSLSKLSFYNVQDFKKIYFWESSISILQIENCPQLIDMEFQIPADTLILINNTSDTFLSNIAYDRIDNIVSICERARTILHYNTPLVETENCANAQEYKTVSKQPSGWQDGSGGTIMNLAELRWLSETPDSWDEDWELGADIDATETRNWNIKGEDTLGFSPIGKARLAYTGNFDGNNHTISNLYINRDDYRYVGFFGLTRKDTISNISITGAISGGECVGGITGCVRGCDIDKTSFSGTIEGMLSVGGITGAVESRSSSISNSYTLGTVKGSDLVGGIAGSLIECTTTSINNCFSFADMYGTYRYGGIVGLNSQETINNSYYAGFIEKSKRSAGLVSVLDIGTVQNCYWDTIVSDHSNGCASMSTSIYIVKGYSPLDFSDQANFIDWDFEYVWIIATIPEIDSIPRPYLRWLVEQTESADTILPEKQTVAKQPSDWQDGSGGIIMNLAELRWFSETSEAWDEDWQLGADIDAAKTRYWNIEGEDTLGYHHHGTFNGTFNGKGHSIRNLYVNDLQNRTTGFFANVQNATIDSLRLDNIVIHGTSSVGGLAGNANNSIISNLFISGTVLCDTLSSTYIGGYFGVSENNVFYSCQSYCYISGRSSIGGITGFSSSDSLYQCYSNADIIANENAGGLLGTDYGSTMHKCYSTSKFTTDFRTGGLIGQSRNSYIYNSFFAGNISAKEHIGGIIGNISEPDSTTVLQNCYSNGIISLRCNAGALLGNMQSLANIDMQNNYYDITIALPCIARCNQYEFDISPEDTAAMHALSSEMFMYKSSFTDWNFDSIWKIALLPEIDSVPRPYLQWMLDLYDSEDTYTFNKGWNLVSFNHTMENENIQSFFGAQIEHILKIRTFDEFYEKNIPSQFNTLDIIQTGKAYYMYADTAFYLNINDNTTQLETTVLKTGWNLISYPLSATTDIEQIISPIAENIALIKDFEGFYYPDGSNNSLTTFKPNKGYLIYVLHECIIDWKR